MMISIDVRPVGDCFVREDGKGWCHNSAGPCALTCARHQRYEAAARQLLSEHEELTAEHRRRMAHDGRIAIATGA